MNDYRHLVPKERPFLGQDLKSDRFKYLRIGRITRVDYETGIVDIDWLDNFGQHKRLYIQNAFGSPRGTIRAMPEVGTVVVCGWIRGSQTLERPIILGYFDFDLSSFHQYRLTRAKASERLQEIKTIREKIGYGSVRIKRRKLYPGEAQIESTQGSELFLDDNVYLADKSLDEVEINSADRSIRLSSRQYYQQSSTSRVWNGLVTREPIEGEQVLPATTLPNGQKVLIVTDSNNPFHIGGRAYGEYRIETYEKSTGSLVVSEVNSGYNVSALKTDTSLVLGTLVGNDKSDVQRYSKVLRPQVFVLPEDTESTVDELECLPEEYDSLAAAFTLKHHKSGAAFYLDKQGHAFLNLPASTGQHPLGAGRSLEANFGGSIKLVVGRNVARERSIILDTTGGVVETLGWDSQNQRSKETIAQKGIYTEILGGDRNGDAYYLRARGNKRVHVDGNYHVNVGGDYIITVSGKITENIMGTKQEQYINDKNNVYGANYKEVVIKHKETTIGATRKVTISGVETEFGEPPITPNDTSDELSIVNGSRDETYTLGNLRRKLTLGDMTAELTAGDKDDKIILGNRKLEVQTGNIEEKITLGDHTEEIATGNKELSITTGDRVVDIVTGSDEETITSGDKTLEVTTGDITRETVTGDMKDDITTGSHETSITAGDLKEEIKTGSRSAKITTGDIEEKITAGSNITEVTTGNIEETITAGNNTEAIVTGNKEIEVTTGNFNVKITAGNVEMKTTAGKVDINTALGTVDISGTLKVTIKSGVKLELSGPLVSIGQLPAKGGVITGIGGASGNVPTHLDYVTGAPLIGSKTVGSAI